MTGFVITKDKDGKKDVDIAHITYDKQVIANNVEERLSIIAGEARYNRFLGIQLKALKDEQDLIIKRIINDSTGVTGIAKFESQVVDRKYSANASIDTIYGEVNVWQTTR